MFHAAWKKLDTTLLAASSLSLYQVSSETRTSSVVVLGNESLLVEVVPSVDLVGVVDLGDLSLELVLVAGNHELLGVVSIVVRAVQEVKKL